MQWTGLVLLFILGCCYCRPEIDLSSAPANINLDEYSMIKERCQKKGKLDTYDKLKTALPETRTCVQNLIDFNKVKDEVEESKKTGSMDEVFGKYCNKRPQFKECIEKSLNLAKECMEDIEIEALKFSGKIAEEIGNFACLNDGDRIAMFVAEGGVECLSSRTSGIQKCINDTIKVDTSNLSFSNLTSATLPTNLNLGITKERCNDITKLQECVVKDLEDNCKDSTPANIVEAVFKFVKKTACKPKQKRNALFSHRLFKRQTQKEVQSEIKLQMTGPISYLEKICNQYGQANASKEFLTSVDRFTECLRPQQVFLRLNKSKFLEKYDQCLNSSKIVEVLENCLPDEGKYVPKFVVDFAKSYVEFMYDHQEFMKVYKDNMEMARCLQTLKIKPNLERIVECAKEVRQFENSVPTKEKVCELISNITTCKVDVIKSVCVQDVRIHQVIEDMKYAFNKPCQTGEHLAIPAN